MCHLDFQAVKGEIGLNGKPGPQGRKVLLDGVHEVHMYVSLLLPISHSLLFRGHLDPQAARDQKDSWSVYCCY